MVARSGRSIDEPETAPHTDREMQVIHTPLMAGVPAMSISSLSASLRHATLPTAGADAGAVGPAGGGVHLDMKRLLLFGLAGAFAGTLVPVIPGGPVGGMLLGAALSMVL